MQDSNEFKRVRDAYYSGLMSAKETVKRLRKLNCKCPSESVQFEITLIEFDNGKKNEMFPKLQKFAMSKNTHIANRAKITLSRYHIQKKELDAARSCLNEVDGTMWAGEKHRQFAVIERENGNYEESRRSYINSLKQNKTPKGYYGLGFLECKYKHYDEAKAYVNILHGIDAHDYADKLQASIDYQLENYEESKQRFLSLIGTRFDNEAKIFLGSIYFTLGNNEIAMSYLEQLYGTDFEDDAIIRIARIKDTEGFHEEALNDYLSVLDRLRDKYIYPDIIKALCNLGGYDEALEYVDKLDKDLEKDNIINNKIYIDIYRHRYRDALDKIQNSNASSKIGKNFLWFYIYHKLFDTSKTTTVDELCYSAKQAFKYKSKWAIKHVKEHLSENEDKSVHTIFYPEVDINSLYFSIRDKIQDVDITSKCFVDYYIIKADYVVGNINGIDTEYVTVITLPETKNILTMYPVVVSKMYKEKETQRKRVESYKIQE